MIAVRGPHPSSNEYYLEVRYDPRKGTNKAGRKDITSLHDDYPGAPSFLGTHPLKSWTTRAAAEAAIPHFRAWVDGGRRSASSGGSSTRAAPSAATASAILKSASCVRAATWAAKDRWCCKLESTSSAAFQSPRHAGSNRDCKASADWGVATSCNPAKATMASRTICFVGTSN